MAVRASGLLTCQLHSLRHGTFLPIRVEQPPPLSSGERCRGEPVLRVQQFLVHYRNFPKTGLRIEP